MFYTSNYQTSKHFFSNAVDNQNPKINNYLLHSNPQMGKSMPKGLVCLSVCYLSLPFSWLITWIRSSQLEHDRAGFVEKQAGMLCFINLLCFDLGARFAQLLRHRVNCWFNPGSNPTTEYCIHTFTATPPKYCKS